MYFVFLLLSCERYRCDSYGCSIRSSNFSERLQAWTFEFGRALFNFNEIAKVLFKSPIYFNHRIAEFKDIVKSFHVDIHGEKGWSYTDSIDKDHVGRVLEHVYYGRMVQSVYHLSDSNVMSERYGESILYRSPNSLTDKGNENETEAATKKFLEHVFKGYKVVDILRTTVDTPNQLRSTTGKFLAELALRNTNMHYHRCKGNFMGFIAYNNATKDLVIVFRGTSLYREWIQNVVGFGSEWRDASDGGQQIDCGCDDEDPAEDLANRSKIYEFRQFSIALFEKPLCSWDFLFLLPGGVVLWLILGTIPIPLKSCYLKTVDFWNNRDMRNYLKWTVLVLSVMFFVGLIDIIVTALWKFELWNSLLILSKITFEIIIPLVIVGFVQFINNALGLFFVVPEMAHWNWIMLLRKTLFIITVFSFVPDTLRPNIFGAALTKTYENYHFLFKLAVNMKFVEYAVGYAHSVWYHIGFFDNAQGGAPGQQAPQGNVQWWDEILRLIKEIFELAKCLFLDIAILFLCGIIAVGLLLSFIIFLLHILQRSPTSTIAKPVFQAGFSELYSTRPESPWDRSPNLAVQEAILSPDFSTLERITIVGHSLGASLAVIAAFHVAKTRKNSSLPAVPIHLITFACPKVGTPAVFKQFSKLNITHYHYLNRGDIVPIIMTGIFTNGLGISNNHVLRLDPANLPQTIVKNLSQAENVTENVDASNLNHFNLSRSIGITYDPRMAQFAEYIYVPVLNLVRYSYLLLSGAMSTLVIPFAELPLSIVRYLINFCTISLHSSLLGETVPDLKGVVSESKLDKARKIKSSWNNF